MAFSATCVSEKLHDFEILSTTCRYRSLVAKSINGYVLVLSCLNTRSTVLNVSTNSRQSVEPIKRSVPILLRTDTWSVACFWFSCKTRSTLLLPEADNCCSIQLNGNARAGPLP